LKAENVKISMNAFKSLVYISDGDMRQAINNLQACHYAAQGKNHSYLGS
jgi:DNA polymerase III delta prime subunit